MSWSTIINMAKEHDYRNMYINNLRNYNTSELVRKSDEVCKLLVGLKKFEIDFVLNHIKATQMEHLTLNEF